MGARSPSRVRRPAVAVALVAAASVSITTFGAGASSGGPRSFYSGTQVSYIAPGYRLSGADGWGRAAAPILSRALGATVSVTDDQAAAPIGGQATLAASRPDGLTLGAIEPAFDLPFQIADKAPLGFKPDDFDVLALVEGGADLVWCVAPGFKDQTMAALLQRKMPAKLAFWTDSDLDALVVRTVDSTLGLKTELIGGYASDQYAVYGFERGDAPLAVAPIYDFLPLMQAGKAIPVMVSNPIPLEGYAGLLNNVPTVAEVASGWHLSTTSSAALTELARIIGPLAGEVVAVPLGVPSERVATLTKAIATAIAKIDPGQQSLVGAPANELYQLAIRDEGALKRYVRGST